MMSSRTLTRIKKVNVRDQVFRQLRDQIIRGIWEAGARIPSESDLCKILGVSRVTLREAMQMLASLGLVETQQGGGTYVRSYSSEILLTPLIPMIALERIDILHVLEYRKIVERGTVALAVERAGQPEIGELEEAYAAMQDSRNDIEAFARADLEFHLALAKASGNPILIKINAVIWDILSASMGEIVSALGTKDGLYYHGAILQAIKERDAAKAGELMEEHIVFTIKRLKQEGGAR